MHIIKFTSVGYGRLDLTDENVQVIKTDQVSCVKFGKLMSVQFTLCSYHVWQMLVHLSISRWPNHRSDTKTRQESTPHQKQTIALHQNYKTCHLWLRFSIVQNKMQEA